MNKKQELESNGYKTYENDKICVFWNQNICQHAGKCVRGNNKVFNVNNRPWIDLSKAPANEIASIIDKCPSKALQYELKDIISVVFEEDNNRSAAYIDKNLVGECEFYISDNNWVISHTSVREKYEGKGIAKRLVKCVIEEARKNHVKVLPICSYAKEMMMGKEEYRDVL